MALHEVPYHRDGYMADAVYRWNVKEIEYRPNAPFEAVMKFVDSGYGASNPKFYFEDENGVGYPMFFTEFMKLLATDKFDGKVTEPLMWHAVKRGTAYGITAINA